MCQSAILGKSLLDLADIGLVLYYKNITVGIEQAISRFYLNQFCSLNLITSKMGPRRTTLSFSSEDAPELEDAHKVYV